MGILLLLLVLVAGCSDPTAPTGEPPDTGIDGLSLLEGSVTWTTTSVSWLNRNGLGLVSEDRYALTTISSQAEIGGPSHFLFQSAVHSGCFSPFCRPGRTWWADPDLFIAELDWSPAGARVVLEGRERLGQGAGPTQVMTMTAAGGNRQVWGTGRTPSFSRDGARIVCADLSGSRLRLFNADTGEGGELYAGLSGIESPRLSPGDSLVAFAAQDGERGRRIFVGDVRRPDFFADPVSDPDDRDGRSRDGVGDGSPTWSPGGRFVAYRSTITRTGSFQDAIFVTEPRAEPESVHKLIAFGPAVRVSHLRWHPGGRLMLLILDNDVYLYAVPERYRDLP